MDRRRWLAVAMAVGLTGSVVGIVRQHGAAQPVHAPTEHRRLHFEISMPFTEGAFPNPPTFDALAAVEDDIISTVEGPGLGEWEGQSVGAGTYDVGILADDEAAVLRVVAQVLSKHGVAKGTVIEITNDSTGDPVRTVRL